jgi:hypothetical protein
MPVMYATCADGQYDAQAGTCAQVVYVEQDPGWIPNMSAEQGAELGVAMFGLFAVAYLLRKARMKI